ncbi:MAG TPA: twin-arginine translocation signal domain-containing protein, partial [Dehalococcoidia bacterium]|nr:twin-arginine translocation signal domain-containing protein [Dehalococcoidia bacterium]
MAGGGALKKLLKRQKLMIDGKIIQPGDKVTTGKGEEYLFDSISRYNETEHGGNSSGKIILRDPTVPEGEPFSTVQYYPSVVGGKLVDPTTTLKRVKRRGGRIRKAKGGKISRRDLLKGLGAGALAAGAGAAGLGKAAVKQGLPEVPIAAVKKALHRRPTISKSWFPKEDWDVVNRYIKKYINDLTDDLASRNPDIDEFPMVLDDELQTLQRIQNLDYSKSMDPFDERYFRNFLEDVTGSIEDDIGRIDAYQNIGDQRYTDYHQIEDMLGEIDEFDMRRNIWDEDAHTVPTNRAEFAELVGSKVEKAGGGLIRKGLKQYQKGPGLHEAAMEAAKAGDADKALEYLKQLQDILQLSDEDFSKMLGAQFDRGPQSSKYVPEVDPDLDAPIGGYKADQRDPDSRMRKAGGGPIDKSIRGALVQAQEAFAKRQGKVKSPDIEIPEGFDSFYTKQYPDRVDIIGVKKDGKEQIVDNIGPGFGDLDSMVLAKELASIYNTGGFSNAYVSRPKLEDLFPPAPPPPPKASVTQIRGGQRAPEGNRLRSFQEHLQNLTKTGNVGVDELQDLSDVAREALSPEDFEIFLEQLDGDGLIPPSQGTRQVPYEPDVTVQMGSTATELKKILAEMGLSPEDLQDPATAFRRLAEMSDEMATRPASYKRPLTYEEHLMETPPARMTLDELEDAFDH